MGSYIALAQQFTCQTTHSLNIFRRLQRSDQTNKKFTVAAIIKSKLLWPKEQ